MTKFGTSYEVPDADLADFHVDDDTINEYHHLRALGEVEHMLIKEKEKTKHYVVQLVRDREVTVVAKSYSLFIAQRKQQEWQADFPNARIELLIVYGPIREEVE
jgi:hypothetical protein